MHDLSVVLLNWNGAEDTVACIQSLVRGGAQPRHIIVVDNASRPGSAASVAEACIRLGTAVHRLADQDIKAGPETFWSQFDGPQGIPEGGVVLLESGTNLGFCVGNNLGAYWAFSLGAESCLILNNDTEVGVDLVGRLSAAANELGPRVLISPQILYADGSEEVWWCGGDFSGRLNPTYLHQRESRLRGLIGFPTTEWVSGCATLISRELYTEMSLYDPVFFIWCEEWDLSLRAAQRGVELRVAPEAIVYHKVGRSLGIVSPLTFFYSLRNMRILRGRYMDSGGRAMFGLSYYPWKALQAVYFSLRYRSPKYTLAFVDSLRSPGGIWKRQ